MTIKDCYNSLSAKERGAVISEIVAKGGCTPSSAYMWLRGERTPLPLYQQLIAKVMRAHTGKELTPEELFTTTN